MLALALGAAACSSGSDIASPGASNPGTAPGGGSGGGGGGSGGGSASCPTGTSNQGALGANTICQLAGEILANLTLPKLTNVVYRINGRVEIGRDLGAGGAAAGGQSAVLTVEPGVRLFGTVAGDMLIVNRGSRIQATGTVNDPIIFTSDKDILGQTDLSSGNRQWGGLIILGRAPIRGCSTAVPAGTVECQQEVEGVTAATGRPALYGGATSADNSGNLQYVQIRFPGAFLTSAAAGDDLNGLTLGGVGSGTTIDHIQIHNSGDDGVEIFGGAINLKHLVITGALDDSLDCDEAWAGNVQFAVIRQTALSGGPDSMVECSNRPKSSTGGTLQTRPTVSNFTFVGLPANSSGSLIRGIALDSEGGQPGASGRFYNGVVAGSTRCLAVASTDNSGTRGAADTANPPTFNSVLFDCPGAYSSVATSRITAGANNSTTTANTLVSVVFPGANETARASVDPTTLGSFFTAASYIGAFSPAETPTSNWAAGWTIQLLPPAGCPTGTVQQGTIQSRPRCVLSGTLGVAGVPAAMRLTAGNFYQINGRVDVGVDLGAAGNAAGGIAASLTIDPGVTLFGAASTDLLIVNRGSQILANGTASAPVVFTSLDALTRSSVNPNANREWGGLIILGRSPIRGCATAVAAGTVECQQEVEGVTAATGRPALYGGATSADNSGRLTYVQIRYPGAFLTSAAAGDDLNGLTLGGVGSNTVLDNIQVHNSGDDGVEIFGGTVNIKRLIITGALDDSLDCDEGWVGNVQFAIIRQSAFSGGPDSMVECSNRPKSSTGGTLQTRPTVSNFTFIGQPTNSGGSVIRGIALDSEGGQPGASGRFYNGVVTGSTRCLAVAATDNSGTRGAADLGANRATFNSVLFNCVGPYSTDATAMITAGANNSTATASSLAQASTPSTALTNFVNGVEETARTAVDPTTLGSFFTAAPYIGAVRNSSDNWWRGWTCGLEAQTC